MASNAVFVLVENEISYDDEKMQSIRGVHVSHSSAVIQASVLHEVYNACYFQIHSMPVQNLGTDDGDIGSCTVTEINEFMQESDIPSGLLDRERAVVAKAAVC